MSNDTLIGFQTEPQTAIAGMPPAGPTRAVALHSGGLDSTVMLYHLTDLGYDVLPISIYYGQRHARELYYADKICSRLGKKFRSVDMVELKRVLAGSGSSQIDDVEVPEGHYAEDNMAITVVPNRNMVLLSIAEAYAIANRATRVAYAAHAGDHAQYPDCRPEFIAAMDKAIQLCDHRPATLLAPFYDWSKADIVRRGAELNVPFDLTWSCYKGEERHCGRCGTCVERAEAFYIAKVDDPTKYDDKYYWRDVTNVD